MSFAVSFGKINHFLKNHGLSARATMAVKLRLGEGDPGKRSERGREREVLPAADGGAGAAAQVRGGRRGAAGGRGGLEAAAGAGAWRGGARRRP